LSLVSTDKHTSGCTTIMISYIRKKVENIQASTRSPESPISILLKSRNASNDTESILTKGYTNAAEETGLQTTDSESCSHSSRMPFRLLPNELLIEIFLLLTQPEDLATCAAPWFLGHISRHWRNVALSTPSLWKYLPPILIGDDTSFESATHQDQRIATLLSRSSGSTISFHLHTSTGSIGSNTLKLILSQSERWEDVTLMYIRDLGSFASIRGRLSSLRSLDFRLWSPNTQSIPVDLFGAAPNLRNVTLYPRPHLVTVELPYRQIRNYKEIMFDPFSIGHFSTFAFSELCTLHFTTNRNVYMSGADSSLRAFGHHTLPKLTFLTFESYYHDKCPRGVLDRLTCPNLREVVFLSFSLHDLSLELQNLIQRSACNLQSLTFFGGSSESLLAILQLTPSLTDLTINDPTLTHMEILTWRSDDLPTSWKLIPQLQTLTFIISKVVTDFLNFVGIVAARCDPERAQSTASRSFRLRLADDRSFDYTDLLLETSSLDSLKRQRKIQILGNQLRAELKRFEYATSSALVTNLANLEVNDLNINLLYVRENTSFESTLAKLIHWQLSNINLLLPRLLHSISTQTKHNPQGTSLRERLLSIIDNWDAVLSKNVSSMRWRWSIDGYLVYISDNDGGFKLVGAQSMTDNEQ